MRAYTKTTDGGVVIDCPDCCSRPVSILRKAFNQLFRNECPTCGDRDFKFSCYDMAFVAQMRGTYQWTIRQMAEEMKIPLRVAIVLARAAKDRYSN